MADKKSQESYFAQIKNYLSQNNYIDALKVIETAITEYPSESSLHINCGNIYKLYGNSKKAEQSYLKALEIKESKEAHNNLSVIYLDHNNFKLSVFHSEKAIKIDSYYIDAHYNFALSNEGLQNYSQAIESAKLILEIDKGNSKALILLYRIYQNTCNWPGIKAISEDLDLCLGNGEEHPFLNISRCDNEETNFIAATSWAKKNQIQNISLPGNQASNKSKIKIGYICGEFKNHPTYHLTKNLFMNHDREEFEVYIFSFNHDSECQEHLKKYVDDFISLNDLNEIDAAGFINNYNLDILIDFSILITNNHIGILKSKPAKRIISYLGYPGTSGHSCYDYLLTDKIVTPENTQKFYTEKFLYLSKCYQINDGVTKFSKSTLSKKDHGLPENRFIMSCFNQSFKIDKEMFDCWVEILKSLPNAIIWLLEDNLDAKKNILEYIKEIDISPDKFIFAKRVSRTDHMDRIKLADVALDTRIYNGHTTTTDALQSLIPVVTLTGHHFASRVSTSLLGSADLTELSCKSLEEYKQKVIEIYKNKDYKAKLKTKLSSIDSKNNFYDTKAFVRDLESLYRKII